MWAEPQKKRNMNINAREKNESMEKKCVFITSHLVPAKTVRSLLVRWEPRARGHYRRTEVQVVQVKSLYSNFLKLNGWTIVRAFEIENEFPWASILG